MSVIVRRWMTPWCVLLGLWAARVSAEAPLPSVAPSLPTISVYGTIGMAPLVPLATHMRATGSIDVTGAVTVTLGGHTMVFTPDSATATRDGAEAPLPLPAVLTEAKQLIVPLQPLVEGLGGSFTIEAERGMVVVTSPRLPTPLELPFAAAPDGDTPDKDADTELYVMNLDGTGLRRLTYDQANNRLPIFVPGAPAFYYDRDGFVVRRAFESPAETRVPRPQGFSALRALVPCGISNDGTLLMTCDPGYTIPSGIYRWREGDALPVTVSEEGKRPVISPDGRTIACLRQREDKTYELYLMDSDGNNRRRIAEQIATRFAPVFSPDGTRLACLHETRVAATRVMWRVGVYYTSGERAGQRCDPLPTEPQTKVENSALFSPDSQSLLIGGMVGLRLMQPDRTQDTALTGMVTYSPAITPDGTQVFFYAGTSIYRMDLATRNMQVVLKNASPQALTCAPDGRRIFFTAHPFVPVAKEQW